ncbi:MAG: type II secretion system GspH family protein, partial [Muribaculaceae bacterium]|nr:type II secretion system GspH family protein [Muribaculaceae bacterium]
EARKNPADNLKSWIASVVGSFAMTVNSHSEQVRAEDESVAYPFNASTVSEESHKLIPAPCGRGSKGEGVTLDKSCDKLSEPVCVAVSGSIHFDEKTLRDKSTLIDSGSEPGMTLSSHCEECNDEAIQVKLVQIFTGLPRRALALLAMTKNTLSKGEGRVRVRHAFTLAEVLITLGIIGVVAAMTIPGLIQNNKATRLRSQFLKSYSTIQQAFRQMEADDVSLDPETYPRLTYYKTFAKYVKVAVDCGTWDSGDYRNKPAVCFQYKYVGNKLTYGGTYKTYDGGGFNEQVLDDGQLVLMDGTNLMFENPNSSHIYVSVDLNGFKTPPNRAGYDLFTFQFLDGELRTMGSKGTTYTNLNTYCSLNSKDQWNGIACAYKAKTETDYFKKVVRELK